MLNCKLLNLILEYLSRQCFNSEKKFCNIIVIVNVDLLLDLVADRDLVGVEMDRLDRNSISVASILDIGGVGCPSN